MNFSRTFIFVSLSSVLWVYAQIFRAKTQRKQVLQKDLDEAAIGSKHIYWNIGAELADKLATDSARRNGFFRVAGNSYDFELAIPFKLRG